jgi:hypothetical protein
MQMIIQFFLDLLQVTGGDLAPEKCVWFLICHRWKKREGTAIKDERVAQGNIHDITVNWDGIGVKRKDPEEGHRTLGFQISGDGKYTAQKKAMKEKAIFLAKQ